MTDLDAIRARHHKHEFMGDCYECLTDWPCDTAIVIAALDAATEACEDRVEAIRAELEG